jgi:site-specific recombinase XerD
MQAKHIRALRNELASTPAAADQRLRALKALFAWAVENDMAASNPTRDVKKVVRPSKGHHSWTMGEIKQYEAWHPIGSKARLAMALIFFTAARREDAIRFGPQHIKDDWLYYTQAKNEHRNPNHMEVEIVPELARAIAATPSGHLTFLLDTRGKPYTVRQFNRVFAKWCDQAGLPQVCRAHGLRYALTGLLIDAQATPHEVMSVTGHRTLAEVERYAKGRNKRVLAHSAMTKLAALRG